MSLQIDRLPLEGPPLCQAYLAGDLKARGFYEAGPPEEPDTYLHLARQIGERTPPARWQTLADAFAPRGEGAGSRFEELTRNSGLFVATGQQAGLFVSPLYTLYKALTAARLAQQLQDLLRRPVMALFSVASEDHDWEEVNHTCVIDTANRLVRLSVGRPGGGAPDAPNPPVERIPLGDDIEIALDELAKLTPDTEFKAEVLEPLREAYRPGRGFGEAFELTLESLLRRYPFLVVRTAHPYVKTATRELLWAEWERREESEARALTRAAELEAAGFNPQVPVALGPTNLFLEGRFGRDRLLRQGGNARLRRSGETISEAELRRTLETSPGRLSPGALLRPVAEANAFPVIAYVAGPSEIAYLAQSQVLFEMHGVPAPVVVPRAAFQLVEPKVARVLDRLGVQPEELKGDRATAIRRLLNQRTPADLQESLERLRRAVGEALSDVEGAAVNFDPGARSAVGSGKKAVYDGIEALEAKLQAKVRERNAVLEQQLEKVAVNLFPEGVRQERALTAYPYLIRYGESLLDRLYAKVATPLD